MRAVFDEVRFTKKEIGTHYGAPISFLVSHLQAKSNSPYHTLTDFPIIME